MNDREKNNGPFHAYKHEKTQMEMKKCQMEFYGVYVYLCIHQ